MNIQNQSITYILAWLLILSLLTAPLPLLAESPLPPSIKFGDSLYGKGDFSLARLEYKRILAHEKDLSREAKELIRSRAGLTLMREHQYRNSLRYLYGRRTFPVMYLRMFSALKSGEIPHAMIAQGHILHSPGITDSQRDEANLLGGTVLLEKANYERARAHYRKLRKETGSQNIKEVSTDILVSLDKFEDQGQKSPFLAGLFSAILPGSGQFYSGHDADGVTALFFNTVFIGSAATLYNLERKSDSGHGASIVFGVLGLFFYLTNISGAIGSAHRYNIYQERKFQQDIRDRFFNLNYVEKTSGIQFDFRF